MTRILAVVALSTFLVLGPTTSVAQDPGYALVATYPHDPEAFTQGLEFKGDRLFETTGLNGRSSLRRVDLVTGRILRRFNLHERHFGEGMTIHDKRLFWITWRSERAFVFVPATFEKVRRLTYSGEGWGLTHDRRRLIMSNGSSSLTFRDPRTFAVVREVDVTDEGERVTELNELEWVNGEIFANVWQTSRIVRIDPRSGDVVGSFDIGTLWEAERSSGDPDVPNGIAYIRDEDRLFVTGKLWRHIYEIRLTG